MAFSSLISLKAFRFSKSSATTTAASRLFPKLNLPSSNPKPFLSSPHFCSWCISVDPDVDDRIPHAKEYPFVSEGCKYPVHFEQDDEVFYARIDLPGADKEGLRVWVENNELHFEAKEAKDDKLIFNKDTDRKYKGRVPFVSGSKYKVKEIEAVIGNGVLKIMVPRATDD